MGFGKIRQYRDRLRDESGQSIILISIVILSFLMFFQFAVSTGLLINAKISVQSAADAAAYAGAAVQARQMNAISYLNYDMRRQYKKFLFRYGFVGRMGNARPPPGAPTGKANDLFYKLDSTVAPKGPAQPMNVPVVCIPITDKLQNSDQCQHVSLPDTAKALGGGDSLNTIVKAVHDQLQNVQDFQNHLCEAQGNLNFFVTLSWLFRADINNDSVTAMLQKLDEARAGSVKIDAKAIVQNLSPLFSGLGLYPRNILNQMRIDTLQKFVNEPHAEGINLGTVNSWTHSSNAEAKERSLQAFHSALANLNATIFDENEVTMDELQADHMLSLDPVLINFNVWVQHMKDSGPSGSAICEASIDEFQAVGVPVAVKATTPPQINYAVHLKTFVKSRGLLYLPNSEPLELDAYAGAKPFGSRMGPSDTGISSLVNSTTLTNRIRPGPVNGQNVDCANALDCMSPYLTVGADASMYSVAYLQALETMAKDANGAYNIAGILKAQSHALAPTPEEVGHYTILPPPQSASDMQHEYIPYATSDQSKTYQFYAPVYPAGGGDPTAIVSAALDRIFAKTQVGNNSNAFNYNTDQMRRMIQEQILAYINSGLSSAKDTELGETLTFASVELPMPTSLQPGNNFWLTQANQVLSSWAPGTMGASPGSLPRFGYSVKFVTMRDLATKGVQSSRDDLSTVGH